jgi:hypothetical protein
MNVAPLASLAALLFATVAVPTPHQRSTPVVIADGMTMAMPGMDSEAHDVGRFRVELAVLPAEPFLRKADTGRAASGMIAVGGAPPVAPNAPSHPNHHLIVHIYDRATGRALRGGHVAMRFTRLDRGSRGGVTRSVPVVEMQAAGKGPQSTHYGNNVFMRAGLYRIVVSIDASMRTSFTVRVS